MSSSPCLSSLYYKFASSFCCLYSLQYDLWVYFLAYVPCSKGEHVSNIWVLPYVLKGIPIWLFFICLILTFFISNSKGLTFFCLWKNQLGSCNNSPFGILPWILKLLASEGAHLQRKLGFHHYISKENSIQLQFACCFQPPWFWKRGQHFFLQKTNLSQYIFLVIHL